MVQMPDSLPSKRRMLAYIAVFFIARLFWKIGKFVHHILTSVNQSSIVHHNCTPPNDYKHQPVTQQSTLALIKEKYPELVGLVESGNLIAFQPQKVLKQILDDQNKQENGHQGLTTVEDVEQLMSSNRLQACMSAPVPELMFVLGTVHVSKQSGEDVKKLIKVGGWLQVGYNLRDACGCFFETVRPQSIDAPLSASKGPPHSQTDYDTPLRLVH